MSKIKNDVSKMPVMAGHCSTCPFKPDENGVWQNIELANVVIQRNFLKSQQICHHPRNVGKKETHRCKGYYDYSYEIYERLGLNPEKNFINNPEK